MMRFVKLIFMFAVTISLVSCGGAFTRLTKPEYGDDKHGYTTNLPVGWVRLTAPSANGALIISKDGYSLQSIKIEALEHAKSFEKIKKVSDEKTPISDLADLELAEIKAGNPNASSMKVLGNTLENVGDQDAYRLHIQYLNDRGLRFQHLVYGFTNESFYYKLSYTAPTLHYFDRDKPVFERVVNSFRLNHAPNQ